MSIFDTIPNRRASESVKWNAYPEDVLPLWVADMDFPSPPQVQEALQKRTVHGVFGYSMEPPGAREAVTGWLERRHGWRVDPESIVFLPGVVTGINLALQVFTRPGDGVVVQTPVYRPILEAAERNERLRQEAPLQRDGAGRYFVERAAFESAFTPQTRAFVLCNPHNPVGRVFTRSELEGMAETCLRHEALIVSDEIHSDLLLEGARHIPIASLSPEVTQRTITLIAPSKTFNLAGLKASVAVIPNPKLRERFAGGFPGVVGKVNLLGMLALETAYRNGDAWLDEVLAYLQGNRDFLIDYTQKHLSGIRVYPPEGTFLAWMDCRESGIQGSPSKFFLKKARVALNDGQWFGPGGKGFMRLNFATSRAVLTEALERMRTVHE